ncbi:MAG: ABC transporter ATP-binding protein [Actinomycetota bacterium]|nr:ABC transporter ATP-binding protein [Actinomycetota bacterium]
MSSRGQQQPSTAAHPVRVQSMTKEYPNGKIAVEEVSFELSPGTFLVLLGPSGSGKTTMLRCLAGIERMSAGRIDIGGRAVAAPGTHLPPEQRELAMVFQDYALWPHLCARDNVAFALKRRGVRREEARWRAEALLGRLGIGALCDRFPSELSGGEQQRVGLARALIGDTGLLLCDEPLSNLDAALREQMRIEISSLVREAGTTTIYITHDQAEAFALADRIGVLERGHLVQLAEPETIYAAPATPFVARFTGLAGELAVRIVGRTPTGAVEVQLSAGTSPTPLRATPGAGLEQHAGDALLLVRPAAVSLVAPDGTGCQLFARVTDVAFRGVGYEHAVVLADGTPLNGIFSPRRARWGENVGVALQPSGCLAFPAGAVASATAVGR